jgi:hypothetical protein
LRKICFLAIAAVLAALTVPALAATQLLSSTFESPAPSPATTDSATGAPIGMFEWTATPWRSSTNSFGGLTWTSSSGNGNGGLDFWGIGATDGPNSGTQEGCDIRATISTVGYSNLHVRYDLKTSLGGSAYGNGGSANVLHGDIAEQLCVQYSTDGGTTWADAEWLRRGGSVGYTGLSPNCSAVPLESYSSWGFRYAALPASCEGQASLMVRFVTESNAGTDHIYLDNVMITGEPVGSSDTTPPGPVTFFTVTAQDGRAHITWTNPSDADFAGVTLVVNGDHTPTSPTDGVVLIDSWSFDPNASKSFDDIGRDPGRAYYYAIWTKDGVPNYETSPQTAGCTMSNYLWRESFETYSTGTIDSTLTGGQWAVANVNVGQVTVSTDEASDGTKCAKIQNVSSAGPSDSIGGAVRDIQTFTGVDGLLQLHYDLKSNVTGGPTFWHVDWADSANARLMDSLGWGDQGAFWAGNDPSNNFIIGTGVWHSVDVIVDTATNATRCYWDGALWKSGTHAAGDIAKRVRLYNMVCGSAWDTSKVYVDNVWITSPVHPRVTAPRDNVWITTTVTPTVTWSRYAAAAAINHQVKICTSDSPESTSVWDSGTIAGGATSAITAPLPQNAHLWAFVREETASGWGYWSPTSNGGFQVSVAAPAAPTVTAPDGTAGSAKPVIIFAGNSHTAIQAKVATDSAGTAIVWDSGQVSSAAFSISSGYLLEATPYWAFVKIGNAGGWSEWSAGLAFTVNMSGELVDIRHMDEANIFADDPGPNDGFTHLVNSSYSDNGGASTTVSLTSSVCNDPKSIALKWSDQGPSRSLRMHKIGTATDFTRIDLDKGVTFMWAVAVLSEAGGDNDGRSWATANTLLVDKETGGSETHFVAIRTLPDGIGIITDNTAGMEGFGAGYTHNWSAWPVSTGYRVIRLTGRNQVPGDYSSTVWNVYVNESPSAAITAIGTMTGSVVESDSSTWPTDYVAIGHGSALATGEIQFDWTAVNCDGDYAPGQWNPVGGATAYASIGAAKSGAAGIESVPVTINGSMVITKIGTHTEPGIDEALYTSDDVTIQDCFFVQDLTNGLLGSAVRVVSSDTHAVGSAVTALSGVLVEQGGCRSLLSPSVTIQGTAAVQPTAMSQKTLMGPCVDQALGSNMDTTGMLVRVFGRVVASDYIATLFSNGGYVIYVDDGSGAVDGRDPVGGTPYQGIRYIIDASDPNAMIPSFGEYVMMEGIAGYESITTGAYPNVRQIMYPTVNILATGL